MKLISFALTLPAFIDGSKDVTRRMGWLSLRAGETLRAVKKAQGLKAGEHPESLGCIKVLSVRRERLGNINAEEVKREGFPGMIPAEFIEFFIKSNAGAAVDSLVTRIEFIRLSQIVLLIGGSRHYESFEIPIDSPNWSMPFVVPDWHTLRERSSTLERYNRTNNFSQYRRIYEYVKN